MTDRDDIIARLTAPGAPFEIRTEPVAGRPAKVFARRHRCLTELLEASRGFGDREYLVTVDSRLTFARHYDRVAALASVLRNEYGVGRGDRVALCAANCPEWIVGFWAAVSLGAIAVGMNSMWAAPEVAHGLDLTTPKVVLTDAARTPLVAAPVLEFGSPEYRELLDRHEGAPLRPEPVDEDDPAVILFTSGTSGRPKGATHSHRNVLAAVWFHLFNDAVAAESGRPARDRRFLLATPLFHIAALHNLAVVRLAVGDAAVLYQGKFDIHRVLDLVQAERVTNWGAVPTMLSRLVEADLSGYDLSALKTVSVSSAPSTAELKDRLREALPGAAASLSTNYGLTESSTAATLATPAELVADPDTAGRPVPNMEVRIRDADGRPVPDGTDGEIHLRGPQVMLGYFNDPAATAAAFTGDGWFRTGDLGHLRDGALFVLSRRSDLILRGAENIYPAEVEEQLAGHPGVAECIVAGLPDPDYGQLVAAKVVLRAESDVDVEELRGYLSARLARYKVPTAWFLTREALPRNATGKVVRRLVRWE
ncbi:fatty acid--CoA ligase [Amycolatopsis sp. AA4]|uniref:class I adenylate-forming enzyme family protein n=1 Tax=Actinomycetes TaxID=1760 RepID=UPI0001B5608F|nr:MULTISPECIES: class I adenylate-forming enzyme family protein [Actinomycetes]ATY13140.1 fatty acid--CoA ligase [Amycolatopsis sp. AA4]